MIELLLYIEGLTDLPREEALSRLRRTADRQRRACARNHWSYDPLRLERVLILIKDIEDESHPH